MKIFIILKLILIVYFTTNLSAQKYQLMKTDFIGVQDISGVLHYILKKQCRNEEGTYMHGIGSSLGIISLKQKTKNDFKGCEYHLRNGDTYILEGLGAENMFLSHSSLIYTQFGKTLSNLMLEWRYNFFSDELTPFDSIKTSSIQLKYYFICNTKIILFEIDNSDFIRMFDHLFTGEIRVTTDSTRVKIGMLFNNNTDLLDHINGILPQKEN